MKTRAITMITACILIVTPSSSYNGEPNNNAENRALNGYLLEAAKNNPEVNYTFMLYKVEMEKIGQAAAYSATEFEVALFPQPMPTVMGREHANISLMQMFPWFGTRSEAKKEAYEMAQMAYEEFRERRDLLFLEVKRRWHDITLLKSKLRSVKSQMLLLENLEQIATQRYIAGGSALESMTSSSNKGTSANTPAMSAAAGMNAGMNTMGRSSAMAEEEKNSMARVKEMPAMSSEGGMAAILIIKIERLEIENDYLSLQNEYRAEVKKFNLLLQRDEQSPVETPDSVILIKSTLSTSEITNQTTTQNPMLRMIEVEERANHHKGKMQKKMGYPMMGLGVEYAIFSKSDHVAESMAKMNGKDMIMPMIKLSIPLFRGNYRSQQREITLRNDALKIKYLHTLNTIQSKQIEINRELDEQTRTITLIDKQLNLSLKAYAMMLSAFSAGQSPLSSLIEMERQILRYKIKKEEAAASYNKLIAEIEKLTSLPSAAEQRISAEKKEPE